MKARPGIRFYLAVVYALFVLVVVGGASQLWSVQQQHATEAALRQDLLEQAQQFSVVRGLSPAEDVAQLDWPGVDSAFQGNLRLAVLTPDLQLRVISGQPLSAEDQAYLLSLGRLALAGQALSRSIEAGASRPETLYAAAPIFDTQHAIKGAVCLWLALPEFETSLAARRRGLVAFSGAAALLTVLLGLGLSELLTRPLDNAQRLAARVASGDYSLRLPESGPRELAELSHHLNRMAEELERQTEARRLVVANVTHELARPLGGLRLAVESLRAGAARDPEFADDLLGEMNRTLGGLEALVDDLALAARLVTRPMTLDLTVVPVEPFLHGLKTRFWPRAEARGVRLVVDLPEPLPGVVADETRLTQALANLIDNALKFTPVDGTVTLSARRVAGEVELQVCDTGRGIAANDLPHIFDLFYQGDAGQRIRQGMGLGLAIARQIVTAHGGDLTVENAPGGGVIGRVTLPAAAP